MVKQRESKIGKETSLNWEVKTEPIIINEINADGWKALTRSDNHKILNICKKSYTPLSNGMFKDTINELSEFSTFPVEKIMEFKGGKVILAFLKNKERLKIANWEADDYLVVGNTHDSSYGFFSGTSSLLIRCMNAFGSISRMDTIYHTKSIISRVDNLVLYYKNYTDERDKMKESFEKWGNIRVTAEVINKFPEMLLDATEKSSTKKMNQVGLLSASIAREIADIGDNYFGLFNGVTHYTTHVREKESNITGSIIGSNAKMNKKAFDLVTELVTNN